MPDYQRKSRILGTIVTIALFIFGYNRWNELDQAAKLHDAGVTGYRNSDFHLAIEPLKEAFAIRKKQLGPANDKTVTTGQFLLTCLEGNGDDKAALKIGTAYLAELEIADRRDGLPYARIETFVGTVESKLGLFDDAIPRLRHAKSIYINTLGDEHKDTFLAMHNLNLALTQAGHIEEAVSEERKLLALKRKVLGGEHRETIKSITNLAFALSKKGDHEEAAKLHEESLEVRRKVFGPQHPETQIEVVNLGIAYSRVGRLEDGIQLCRQGYQFFLGHYPEGHPDIRWAALNLRNLLSFTDREEEKDKLTELYNLK